MWSLACVCAEMYLGLPLFPGVSQHNQLTRIIEMMGYPPDSLIEGKNGSKYFSRVSSYISGSSNSAYSSQSDNSPKELWGSSPQSQTAQKYHLKTAEEYALETNTEIPILRKYLRYSKLDDVIMKCPLANKSRMNPDQKKEEMLRRLCFLNFLEGLFKMNPFERWTAKQAANHPFITNAPYTGHFNPAVDPKINERKLAYFVQTQRRDNTVKGSSYLQGNAANSLEITSDGMHVFRPLQFRRLSEPLRLSPAGVKEVRVEEEKDQGPSLQRGQSVRELDSQPATNQLQTQYHHQSLPYNSSQYMQQQQQYLRKQQVHQQQYAEIQQTQQPEQYSAYSASTTEGVWASYIIKEQAATSSSNSHYMEAFPNACSQAASTMVRNAASCDDLPLSAMMNVKGRGMPGGENCDLSWNHNFNSNGRDSRESSFPTTFNSSGHHQQQQQKSYMHTDSGGNLPHSKRSNTDINHSRNDYRHRNQNHRMSPQQYQIPSSQQFQQLQSHDQSKGHRGQQLLQQQLNSAQQQQYSINMSQQQVQLQPQLHASSEFNLSSTQSDAYQNSNYMVSGSMDSTSGSGFEGFGGSMTDVPLMMTDFGQALMRPELDERRRLHSMQSVGGQMPHDQQFNGDRSKGNMWTNQGQQSQLFTRQRMSQLPYYPPQQPQHQQHLHQQINQQSQQFIHGQGQNRGYRQQHQQQQWISSSQDKHDGRHMNIKEQPRSKSNYVASSSDAVASSSAMSALTDRIIAAGGGGRGDDHTDQGRSVSFAESKSKDSDTHNYVAQLIISSRTSSGYISGTNSPGRQQDGKNVEVVGGVDRVSNSGNSNGDSTDRKSSLKGVASRSTSSDTSCKTQVNVGDVTDALGDWDPFFGGDDFEMEEELDGGEDKKILPQSISAATSGSRSGSAAMSDRGSTDDGDIDPDVDESEWRSAGSRGNSADVNPTPEPPYRKLV